MQLSSGPIALFARHPVAANLLMALMLLFGVWGMSQLSRAVLPEVTLNMIMVSVQWPGASTEDIEANILEAIEPEVRFQDDVTRVDSFAYEGRGELTIRYTVDADVAKALSEVQAAVARITTFPQDIERPVISQVDLTVDVCGIEISGPFSEQTLKLIARRMRDDLLDRGLARVDLKGVRETEIWVELSQESLRQLDMTLGDVARRIENSSLDLPSGSIEAGGVSRQIRSEGLARTVADVGDIEILSRQSGEKLSLRDIARILETAEENAISRSKSGYRSIGLSVRSFRGQDAIEAQEAVQAYLDKIRPSLPPTLRVEQFDVFADQVTQRIDMLTSNGLGGLMLVLGVLFLFLNGRVAFWVAMGIPISIAATLGAMSMVGLTLNMISMFAIIMGLGIIVDDAIVVGEHTEMLHRHGMNPEQATMEGARRMLAPVMAASLTTVAAFLPTLTLEDTIGQMVSPLAVTIVMVILASLVECFLVLPMHLKHALVRMEESRKRTPGALARRVNEFLSSFRQGFNHFRDGKFSRISESAFNRRYTTILAVLCAFTLAFSLLISGRVGFEFFASPEPNVVFGNFSLAPGSSRVQTEEMAEEVLRAAREVERQYGGAAGSLIRYSVAIAGTTEGREGEPATRGDHAGAVVIELVPSDTRDIRTVEYIRAWEQEIRPVPGVEKLLIFERTAGGPPGRDIDIRLHGADLGTLKQAALDVREALTTIPGIMAIDDDLPWGKQEIALEVTPEGKAMGFTTSEVARQVRNAYEGAVARRFARDQEEVIVRVRLESQIRAGDSIRELYLRTADGNEVPLTEVVTMRYQVGFSQVHRENGLRQVSVTADVDTSKTTSGIVLDTFDSRSRDDIAKRYGIVIEYKGKAEEQAAALDDLQIALFMSLALIYIILAWVFSSYTRPLVVMAVIPFGLTGALFGHWVTGFNVNMLSLVALLGLAGVMVNDSIILVTTVRRAAREGAEFAAAINQATRERLRPVMLTTLTTVGGLTPLLFERSIQADLVQPLAVTLIFGLMFSPFLVLFFVPALLGVGDDVRRRRSTQGEFEPQVS